MRKRFFYIDVARAIAVLLMIIAHTIAFFASTQNQFLHLLQILGDTVCFTTFLFLSGMSSYYSYLKGYVTESEKKRLLKRLLRLVIYYYLAVITIIFTTQSFNENTFNTLIKNFVLIEIPSYTEFILPFIFFNFLTLFFYKQIKFFTSRLSMLVISSVLFYLTGFIFSKANFGDFQIIQKIIFGQQNYYSFPIFQYFPIFLLGIFFASKMSKVKQIYIKSFFISLFFTSIFLLIAKAFDVKDLFISRWPPSITFLSISISGTFLILILSKINLIHKPLIPIGKNALDIYLFHLILTLIIKYFFNINTSSFALILLLILIITCLSLFFCIKKIKYFFYLFFYLVILFNFFKIDKEIIINQPVLNENLIEPYIINATINRNWFLKEQRNSEKVIIFANIDNGSYENFDVLYQIDNDNIGKFDKNNKLEFTAVIDQDQLDTGEHELKIFISFMKDDQIKENVFNKSLKFYVSYPVFVNFTIDYEGTNVDNSNRELISNFATKNNLKITHYFNPRIYVNKQISTKERDEITKWILERQAAGDEIALHLHMHFDLVENAGIPVRKTPTWNNQTDGHDVPCSAYTYNEFRIILSWAKAKFEENGLGTPINFRAGGWFANLDTIKALNSENFLIDSSGRTATRWGKNLLKNDWDLTNTTQPYFISSKNQNSTLEPQLEIMEIPNNGGTTYSNQGKYLIENFKANFKNEINEKPIAITFLSHAHDFKVDEKELSSILTEIDKFRFDKDLGAVVISTVYETYDFYNIYLQK